MGWFFRKKGKLIYKNRGNPYEVHEIYLEQDPRGVTVKSYISEKGPDGGSSWRELFIDEKNRRKLELDTGKRIKRFLKRYFRKHAGCDISGLAKLLDAYEMEYSQKYFF